MSYYVRTADGTVTDRADSYTAALRLADYRSRTTLRPHHVSPQPER